MSLLVEFQGVSRSFGDTQLIDKVSFEIQRGTLTTLIGPNGAGKTTIARLMLGLDKPSSGKIITAPNLKLGYVPQKLNFSQNLPMTVANFVQLLAPGFAPEAIEEFGGLIDLKKLQGSDVATLSGGQFQKLILTAALLNRPDLIVLDEPIQALDVGSQQEFYRLLEQIRQNYGTTIFMVSHDLFTVMKKSDLVICLNKHICCSGRPEDLNNNPDFINALSMVGIYTHHHDHKHH